MAGGVTVKISNQLFDRLRRLPEEVQRVASDEIHQTAIKVRDEARRMAPRRTGALAASIVAADSPEAIKEGRDTFAEGGLTAAVGTNLFYARWVHFGRKRGPSMPATPFLLVPAEAERLAFFRRVRKVVKDGAGAV